MKKFGGDLFLEFYTVYYRMAPVIFKIGAFRARKKIAAFDYDWTLVKPKSGGTFPRNVDDWTWLNGMVVEVVKKAYSRGFAIVVFTNQTKAWKCDQIRAALGGLGVPVLVAVGMEKADQKPAAVLFDAAVTWKWDREVSYFVGDALGRKGDWSDSDLVFAERAGFTKILAPEDVFPYAGHHGDGKGKKAKGANEAKGVKARGTPEVIIMIGYPGSGKSTIVRDIFAAAGYAVMSGDELKTSAKMIKTAAAALGDGVGVEGVKSVVFDATNPSKKKRAEYIDFAKKRGLPVRCIHVATSLEESMANNQKRPVDKIIPRIAYNLYKKNFEEPSVSEGCEVVIV
jgi:bifunctional polynucleotide phosphatase/kinase